MRCREKGFVDRIERIEHVVEPRGVFVIAEQWHPGPRGAGARQVQAQGDFGVFLIFIQRRFVVAVPRKMRQDALKLRPWAPVRNVVVNFEAEAE